MATEKQKTGDRPRTGSLRWESKAQVRRIRQAAKLRKWSLNQFVIEAASKEAEKVLTAVQESGQIMVESDQPALNQ